MFVVHALVLTFMTTPLTLLFYPPRYRQSLGTKPGKAGGVDPETVRGGPPVDSELRTKFALVLEKVEQLAPAMTLTQLLQPNDTPQRASFRKATEAGFESDEESSDNSSRIKVDTLRLIELTNRTSAVIRSQESSGLLYNDPVVSAYRTFGNLNRLVVSASLSVVSHGEFPEAISQHAINSEAEMVIIPWSRGTTSLLSGESSSDGRNPFDGAFHKTTTQDQTSSIVYSEFIRSVFLRTPQDVALFVDRGVPTSSIANDQLLFLPFFGGPDDRLALTFIVQLCIRTGVHAKVVRIQRSEEDTESAKPLDKDAAGPLSPGANNINAVCALLHLSCRYPHSQVSSIRLRLRIPSTVH